METILKTKAEKTMENKLNDIEIERFSISSFNSFRRNRFTWYLRYILDFKSKWPMEGAWRGQAIEDAVMRGMAAKSESTDSLLEYAILAYQRRVTENLLKVYPKILDGYNIEQVVKLMEGMTKEKFPNAISSIVKSHLNLNDPLSLPEYLLPESEAFEKYIKKIEKQYAVIESSVPEAVSWFRNQDTGYEYQRKLSYNEFNLGIPVIGFTDFEFAGFGTDLKTGQTLPKNWDSVSLDHKLQAAFYSLVTGKPWKIIYVSRLSNDSIKENLIHELHLKGLSSKEIATRYKDISPDGKGTTEPTVIKILEEIGRDNEWEPHKPIKIFDVPMEELESLNQINRLTGQSILMMISKSRRDHLGEDMKFFCIGDLDHMYLNPDEKEKIREVWGLDIRAEEVAA